MHNNSLPISEFIIEGKFQGFVSDRNGKFKYLQMTTESGDIQIKIPKKLRLPLSLSLEPGEQIRVSGVSQSDSQTGGYSHGEDSYLAPSEDFVCPMIKLRAYGVTKIGCCQTQNSLTSEMSAHSKAKIIVCQKSGCLKRGGKSLLVELHKILRDRGLQDRVTVEYSSQCLKCCKNAPNYILQVGDKEYKNIQPEAIASLLGTSN